MVLVVDRWRWWRDGGPIRDGKVVTGSGGWHGGDGRQWAGLGFLSLDPVFPVERERAKGKEKTTKGPW